MAVAMGKQRLDDGKRDEDSDGDGDTGHRDKFRRK